MSLLTVQTAETEFVTTKDGINLAYRRIGSSTGVPLLFLQHFRATIDHWDPLLVHLLATNRPVILLDNAGIGHSSGPVDDSIPKMADHVIEFLSLLGIKQVDILGFSLGGMIAPLVYLNGPAGLVRKLVLTGTSATAGPDILPSMTDERVIKHAVQEDVRLEGFLALFFKPSKASEAAGRAWWDRIHERNKKTSGEDRADYLSNGLKDEGAGKMALVTALIRAGDIANAAEGSYDRLGEIDIPVLVANGNEDIMVPTVNSFHTSQKIPNALLLVYPDAGHGFLFQYVEHFAKQAGEFLDEWK